MFGEDAQKAHNSLQGEQLFISPDAPREENEWNQVDFDGQLTVDVIETHDSLVVVATMAGTKPEDIDLHLHNDCLTIRGKRVMPVEGRYFVQECFWGKFSRTIVLPVDVRGEMARSEYKNGILTIILPKANPKQAIPILVIDD